MSSAQPARASARQSARRQQELEAEREAKQRRTLAAEAEAVTATDTVKPPQTQRQTNGRNEDNNNTTNDETLSLTSSSRSLSPALSDSASLNSDNENEHSNKKSITKTRALASRTRSALTQQQQEQDEQDPSKPFSDPNLLSYWEIALVYGFMIKFKTLLRQNCPLHDFSIEDLEAGLLSKTPNVCIEEVHSNLLSNMLNRKKAVDSSTWQKVLSETLDSKFRTGEMEYDQNLLKYYGDYYLIPPEDRVQILKGLVHWVLQEGAIIRQAIEEDLEHYSITPFGIDQAKRIYWYFGEGTLRVFRETKNPKKKSTGWETVASSLDEIKALVDSFNQTSSKSEKALQERLREEIIDPIEEKMAQEKLKQERLEKKMQRLAELHQLAATRTTRTRSSNRLNQPKYNFDDDDDFEEDEYEIYRRPSSRRRHNNQLPHHNQDQYQNQDQNQNQSQNQVDNTNDTPITTTNDISTESNTLFNTATGSADQYHINGGTEVSLRNTNSDSYHHPHQQQQQHDEYKDRGSSVEGDDISSTRSSVGRESDTSIRMALQRARMDGGDDEEEEFRFKEEPEEDDVKFPSVSQSVFAHAPTLTTAHVNTAYENQPSTGPVLELISTSAPVLPTTQSQDVDMKDAEL
ncbi:hypothetical protein BX616_006918 [Lobosporangium transversale]|uniref:DDT domain-containing protein n=1 Tax=Lobosporangium transversale TaxID=64571 RepID=A0A1Y2GLE1_9FUNG|nr:hypothetical protein BCR41DRAFT_387338 [Lobosporangium transversale]KAF9915091.1 hypothetical protein BX616_006918 [Lobosporangium transversale]ORZ12973.1 hypothetical protein BCR41DRAFT_387338 [Lobosporangium transversale]|eukprot:XP_021880322.1 hypothetical protein BCR41DRAFT_387338 [Lobosporangium transversale]